MSGGERGAEIGRAAASLLSDTARLGNQTFACRYDEHSATVYTYAAVAFMVGDVLDLPDRRLLVESVERSAGVTRIRTRNAPPRNGDAS